MNRNITEFLNSRNEVKLSSENIELKNLATLEKLYDQAVAVIPELKKLQGWISLQFKNKMEYDKQLPKAVTNYDKARGKSDKLFLEAERASEESRVFEKTLTDLKERIQRNDEFAKDINKKMSTDGKKNNSLRKELEKGIADFSSAAKALGVDVKVDKYEKILGTLRGLPAN